MFTPNCRPITDATRSVRLLSCGSLSMRASSRPWSVSGISTPATRSLATQRSPSRTMAPRSMSIRMTSSTKNGFPSAFARTRSRVPAGNESICRRVRDEGAAVLRRQRLQSNLGQCVAEDVASSGDQPPAGRRRVRAES